MSCKDYCHCLALPSRLHDPRKLQCAERTVRVSLHSYGYGV